MLHGGCGCMAGALSASHRATAQQGRGEANALFVAFIEVKARVKRSDLSTAIDGWRLRRVAAAAEQLLPRYGKGAENMRIDVILVAPWRWPHHLVNVWHG